MDTTEFRACRQALYLGLEGRAKVDLDENVNFVVVVLSPLPGVRVTATDAATALRILGEHAPGQAHHAMIAPLHESIADVIKVELGRAFREAGAKLKGQS